MGIGKLLAAAVVALYTVSATSRTVPEAKDVGYFWQVTDFHFDANYSVAGDPTQMCHLAGAPSSQNLGRFGDFRCDSPWLLVSSAIEAMYHFKSNPDFIIWTGDTTPHIPDYMLSDNTVIALIHNLSMSLLDVFPNTSVYPSFGNHDVHPSGIMPAMNTTYYDRVLNMSGWESFLPSGSAETFRTGGYYSHSHSPKLMVVSLNTALYYINDNITAKLPDPAEQLTWLEKQLQSARASNSKVYVTAHVPPGMFERVPFAKFMQDDFNSRYTAVLLSYSDVIAGQFYGHAHTDSFRLIGDYSVEDVSSGAAFLCPSVTPLGGILPGRNPSIRLYSYDKSTMTILDYTQYYFNLTAANANVPPGSEKPDASKFWTEEYSFTATYNTGDASAESLLKVWRSFANSSSSTFASYLKFNSFGQDGGLCDSACSAAHFCAIGHVDYAAYRLCIDNHGTTTELHTTVTTSHSTHHGHSYPAPSYMHYVIAAVAGASVVAAVAAIAWFFRRRQLRRRGSSRRSRGSYEPLA